ncbi:sigma-70 region 4 domain protein [[Actinomadura] parvosata subsp. kistnae]|uniref:SigE family RNA polymerase sigma factor n=1 Tax=[Actinomadura] parvosata TaxID=1955412 RepID=UPI000D2A1C88|nr:sigma-70 region 4 domain protein [Actinomadura parvosata subsp. kistnae]
MDRHEGFREFVLARQQALTRSAYLLTGDAHLAEDLLQSVLLNVADHWPRLVRRGIPEAYTRKAMINQYISWRRRKHMESPSADLPEHGHAHDDAAVDRIVLRQALAKLTPRQRAVIVLRFYEDLSERESAEILGCSVGTVKSQTHHALGRLRILAPELSKLFADAEEVSR